MDAFETFLSEDYIPNFESRATTIVTDCFSPTLLFQVEKNWSNLSVFANYSHAIYITKSKSYFGETNGKSYPLPNSLNEAVRFPGKLMLGCRINWGD